MAANRPVSEEPIRADTGLVEGTPGNNGQG